MIEAIQLAADDPDSLPKLIASASRLLASRTSIWSARQVLHNVCAELDDRPAIADIALSIADRFHITLDDLRGPSRAKWAVVPRQEVMWMAHKTGRFSLCQIGRFLGNRDHTTVLHGIRAHERREALQAH